MMVCTLPALVGNHTSTGRKRSKLTTECGNVASVLGRHEKAVKVNQERVLSIYLESFELLFLGKY